MTAVIDRLIRNRHLPWIASVVGSLLGACVCYKIWNANIGIPFSYSGDGLTNAMAFKAAIENGSIWSNPHLGAPFAQHYQDWPLTDLFPIYVGKALSVFTSNWAACLNVVYLLGFPAIGATSWWVMRRLGISSWVATTLSILYALAPYHFGRGPSHFFLSGYFVVPLGAWFAMCVLGHEQLFNVRTSGNIFRRVATWKNVRTVLFAVLIVSTSIYYAVFSSVLIAAAIIVALLQRKGKNVLHALIVLGVFGLTFFVLALPTFLFRDEFGPNILGAKRLQSDTETYGLKLAQMLLPTNAHRIPAFDKLRFDYIDNFPVPSEHISTALGLTASVGLLFLFALVARRLICASHSVTVESRLAFLSIIAFVTATVGGFATLISLLLTSQIRGWNRMSIVIAFLALCALGLLFDRLARQVSFRAKPLIAGLLLSLLLVGGTYDQYGKTVGIAYEENRMHFLDDADFFGRIDRQFPRKAQVFQLPRTQFPEPMKLQYGRMDAYDPLRPYLHTKNIYWSFGGIEGRVEADWQSRVSTTDIAKMLEELRAAGFSGLLIDRYADDRLARSQETQITQLIGKSPQVSRDDRWSFFDLRNFDSHAKPNDVTSRESLFFPVTFQLSDPKYRPETDVSGTFVWAPEDVEIPLSNVSNQSKQSIVSFSVVPGNGQPTKFHIVWPDKTVTDIEASAQPTLVTKHLTLKPGRSEIVIDSNATPINGPVDKREMSFRIINRNVAPAFD